MTMHIPVCDRLAAVLICAVLAWSGVGAEDARLQNAAGSLKFAVIGDSGTGERPQYDVAAQMARVRAQFAFEMVIMLGDNIYGRQRPEDFVRKFELPYKPLLDAGVRFYASLGNHDAPTGRFYKPWNMNGNRYYTFVERNVRFFVLDTNDLDRGQREWIERELKSSDEAWKIAYFHHPLYSSAERHGSELTLRVALEPLFRMYGVRVVFAGHDHVYERFRPQNGIYHFVCGSAGQLRRGGLRRSAVTAAGYDQEQTFMLVEIDEDVMAFQAMTLTGKVVDSGSIQRRSQSVGVATQGASRAPQLSGQRGAS